MPPPNCSINRAVTKRKRTSGKMTKKLIIRPQLWRPRKSMTNVNIHKSAKFMITFNLAYVDVDPLSWWPITVFWKYPETDHERCELSFKIDELFHVRIHSAYYKEGDFNCDNNNHNADSCSFCWFFFAILIKF